MVHTVLLSVPQKLLLQQIRDFLRQAGLEVVEAATEDAAFQILCESWPEVQLLLMETARKDMPNLTRRAAQCRPGMRILVLSSDPEYVNRALMPCGQIDFLEKPFAWCDLKRKIDEIIGASPEPRSAGAPEPRTAGAPYMF